MPSEDPHRQLRTGEDRRDRRRGGSRLDARAELDAVQLEVVGGGHGHVVAIEHLPIEDVQVGIEHLSCRRRRGIRLEGVVVLGHAPAPVTMSRGMAAIAAARMMTR